VLTGKMPDGPISLVIFLTFHKELHFGQPLNGRNYAFKFAAILIETTVGFENGFINKTCHGSRVDQSERLLKMIPTD
jgi:hypothetical protein